MNRLIFDRLTFVIAFPALAAAPVELYACAPAQDPFGTQMLKRMSKPRESHQSKYLKEISSKVPSFFLGMSSLFSSVNA